MILKKLDEIQQLKNKVVQRVWSTARPVHEIDEQQPEHKGEALSQDAIKNRIELLAEQIIKQYPDCNPVLVSLMDGALPFATLLHTALNERGYKYTYTTMQASSYAHELTSGELKIGSMPKIALGGRTVFILDDVCDTGMTYLKIRELFEEQGAKKVSLVALVDKVQRRINGYTPEYTGFRVSADAFIVGMGLDYYGELRNEVDIRGVDLSSLPTDEEKALLALESQLNKELALLLAAEKTAKPGSSGLGLFGSSERTPSNISSEPSSSECLGL